MLKILCSAAIFFLFLNPLFNLLSLLSAIFCITLIRKEPALALFCALLGLIVSQFEQSLYPLAIFIENTTLNTPFESIKNTPIIGYLQLENPLVLSSLISSVVLSLLSIAIYQTPPFKFTSQSTLQKILLKISTPLMGKMGVIFSLMIIGIVTFFYFNTAKWVTKHLENLAKQNDHTLKIEQLNLNPTAPSIEQIFYQPKASQISIELTKISMKLNTNELLKRHITTDGITLQTLHISTQQTPSNHSIKKNTPNATLATPKNTTNQTAINPIEFKRYLTLWQKHYPEIKQAINTLLNIYQSHTPSSIHYKLNKQYPFWTVNFGPITLDQIQIDGVSLPIKNIAVTYDEKKGHDLSIELDDSIFTRYIQQKTKGLLDVIEKKSTNIFNNLFK